MLQYYGFSYSENPNDVFQLPSLSEWLEQQGMPGTRKGLERIGAMGILSHLESPKLLVRQDAAMRVSVEDGTLHAMRVFHDQLQSGSASGGESPAGMTKARPVCAAWLKGPCVYAAMCNVVYRPLAHARMR